MRILDGRIREERLLDDEVTDAKLHSLFQMDRLVAIGSVEATVAFGTAYGDTPVVTTAPGPDISYARITGVWPESFTWVADTPGSASWMAWGHR